MRMKRQFLLKSISGLQSVTSTLSETRPAPAYAWAGPAGGWRRFKVRQEYADYRVQRGYAYDVRRVTHSTYVYALPTPA